MAQTSSKARFSAPRGWQAVASAILLLLAFPPFHLTLLCFVALAPWLADLRSLSGRRAWRSGCLFGFVYMGGQMYWLLPFIDRWTGSWALAAVPWLLASLLLCLHFGLAGVVCRICWIRGWWWAVPIAWAGVEVFRSFVPALAFPWGLIATPLVAFPPAIQTARIATVFGVGAWVVLANVLTAMAFFNEGHTGAARPIRAGALAFIVILAGSLVRYAIPFSGESYKAVVGQPGVDEAFGDPDQNKANLRIAVEAVYSSAQANRADLIVLPEGISSAPNGMPPIAPFPIEASPPILFGGTRGTDPTYQDAFAFDGQNWSYADKTRLVLFGEYVPGRKFLPFLDKFNLPSGDLVAGDKLKCLPVRGVKIGPLLCFEGLFPDVAMRQANRGARLLAVMSIDDWYMDSNAPEQLASASIWRAIETGLPVVRSATTGISMAVDQRGNVLARAPIGERYSFAAVLKIPTDQGGSPWLPLFPAVAVLSLPALLAHHAILRRRAA